MLWEAVLGAQISTAKPPELMPPYMVVSALVVSYGSGDCYPGGSSMSSQAPLEREAEGHSAPGKQAMS